MTTGRITSVFMAVLIIGSATSSAGGLDFARRVDAQEAIERVSYSHQTGATREFDEAVPRELLERKVRGYLQRTAALEKYWGTKLTAEMLQREAVRIAASTRMPERLLEIYHALGNDPVLIQECFVRPVLVERLARAAFESDERIHGKSRRQAEGLRQDKPSWEEWWQQVEAGLDPDAVGSLADASATLPSPGLTATCDPAGVWDNGILDDPPPPPTARAGHRAVWTGSELIVWGGAATLAGDRYDPVSNSWRRTSAVNAPAQRNSHTAVWTGSKMIVWGGSSSSSGQALNSGGVYDPATDTWIATSLVNAPSARSSHSAIWTGSELIVWAGAGALELNTGGRYNPSTDAWVSTSTVGAPSGRHSHTAIWTGSRMVVWGGYESGVGALDTGGVYDRESDSWTATSTAGAPAARYDFTSVWTGSGMIVWGGLDQSVTRLNSGGRFDPALNSWTPTSTAAAPVGRYGHTAVWTGSSMVVWGGEGRNTGGRYDPALDTWASTTMSAAPSGRSAHSAIWTGSRMIVWGGIVSSSATDSGSRYDPSTDTWASTITTSFGANAGVWDGNELLIYDGSRGRRYSPLTDTWGVMSSVNRPPMFGTHEAVWSGSEMIVWGGSTSNGGRYDPIADTWTLTSTVGAPQARNDPTAVWTGSEMIVWGGWVNLSTTLNTGGRYNPATDTWSPTSVTNAPTKRAFHSTVWTGAEMIVWGGAGLDGFQDDGEINTGGRYNPSTDTWTPTSLINTPSRRQRHTAIWSGNEMVVFGGELNEINFGQNYRTGGRYDPVTDAWIATPTTGAPPETYNHKAVWTGSEMLVITGNGSTPGAARYDPAANVWRSMSVVGKPPANYASVAVWTGNAMLVWAGTASGGGRYILPSAGADGDADGVRVCDGDCNDADASIWGTPGETLNLDLSAAPAPGSATLSWSAPSPMGGVAVAYDTLRATGSTLFMGAGATCVESDDGADMAAVDAAVPPPGATYYYLVRARNACPSGLGSLGFMSSGTARTGRTCP